MSGLRHTRMVNRDGARNAKCRQGAAEPSPAGCILVGPPVEPYRPPDRLKRPKRSCVKSMSSATATSIPTASGRLAVDTDVAGFVFKWHPEFASFYIDIIRGSELAVSFMTLAEMRQGALDANWGQRKRDVLEEYLAEFAVLHSDSVLCSVWAAVRNESARKGRQISSADAWIAATALVLSAPLVTNNPKDYRHLGKLQVVTAA